MSRVRIPPVLRDTAGGAREVEARGSNVAEVLEDLFARHPELRERVTENGALSRYVNVYVNDRDGSYRAGLETALGPDDTVILLPAMAGGVMPHAYPAGS